MCTIISNNKYCSQARMATAKQTGGEDLKGSCVFRKVLFCHCYEAIFTKCKIVVNNFGMVDMQQSQSKAENISSLYLSALLSSSLTIFDFPLSLSHSAPQSSSLQPAQLLSRSRPQLPPPHLPSHPLLIEQNPLCSILHMHSFSVRCTFSRWMHHNFLQYAQCTPTFHVHRVASFFSMPFLLVKTISILWICVYECLPFSRSPNSLFLCTHS